MQWTMETMMSSTDTNARLDGSSDILRHARAMVARTSACWQSTGDSRSPMLSGGMRQSNGDAATGESMGGGSNAN